MTTKIYDVPASRLYGGILHTERCRRCQRAVVATDYREPELNGTQRHVWLEASTLTVDFRCAEHVCGEKNRKPGRETLYD